jgi:hypothetical protein
VISFILVQLSRSFTNQSRCAVHHTALLVTTPAETACQCLFYPGKGLINPSKGLINPRVYEHWYRRAAASWGAFIRQACSERTWDEKQTRPFDESQRNTSTLPSSRQEEQTFVVRPPHTTQFLCARDGFSCPSLSLFFFLAAGHEARSQTSASAGWAHYSLRARAGRQNQSRCQ